MITLMPVMKKHSTGAVRPNRKRIPANVTLSEDTIAKGKLLAEAMGIKFSQLLEMLVRDELRKRGELIDGTGEARK